MTGCPSHVVHTSKVPVLCTDWRAITRTCSGVSFTLLTWLRNDVNYVMLITGPNQCGIIHHSGGRCPYSAPEHLYSSRFGWPVSARLGSAMDGINGSSISPESGIRINQKDFSATRSMKKNVNPAE